MHEWLNHEPLLRLIPFAAIFLVMVVWEILSPRRTLSINKSYRWFNNLAMVLVNSMVLRFIFPGAAVGVAVWVESERWGLMNYSPLLDWPLWINAIIGLVLLDFIIWLQHLLFHKTPVLWRLHRMHHADQDIDVTTGLRFHPLEIILSMVIKVAAILIFGVPVVAVFLFEVLLNATSMFNHGNVYIPKRLDRILRWFIVTPDMHRVHHSWHQDETNSNFGFNLPLWDRLLGTYKDQPRDGHHKMTIGINQFRAYEDLRIDRLLLQPFSNTDDLT
jgi:sterol desaturase/sphingolipid hydroxylase (fatty acid hydroxylase superfamily)